MSVAPKFEALEALPRTPASDVKKLGWRGVMRSVARDGQVVVTNHNTPEAVILSAETYDAMLRALEAAAAPQRSALEELQARFDSRLVSLQAADAGDRLREVMDRPVALRGRVRAGGSH